MHCLQCFYCFFFYLALIESNYRLFFTNLLDEGEMKVKKVEGMGGLFNFFLMKYLFYPKEQNQETMLLGQFSNFIMVHLSSQNLKVAITSFCFYNT
jgi:hypothetical protein